MQVDLSAREVTLKLVYYGPASGGKTANLVALHALAGPNAGGRLTTIETGEDRTMFFDLVMDASAQEADSLTLRIKLFAVPAQPMHSATRKLVLNGADGVAFIADSQVSETENNAASFMELCENLKAGGAEVGRVPLVIQLNKRDLPNVRTTEELGAIATRGKEPVFLATAKDGDGVVETLIGLVHLVWAIKGSELATHFGVERDDVLASVARQLKANGPIASLLAKSICGSYSPIGQPLP